MAKSDSIYYFEDLVLDYFQKAQNQINISSPDDYDEIWLSSFDKIKAAYKKADKSYLSDAELIKTLENLNKILNNGSLSCRELFQKSYNLIATAKELGVAVVCGVDKHRFTDRTNGVVSFDNINDAQVVCVDICYDNSASLPYCEAECLYQAPATNVNIESARSLLAALGSTYNIPVFDESRSSLEEKIQLAQKREGQAESQPKERTETVLNDR